MAVGGCASLMTEGGSAGAGIGGAAIANAVTRNGAVAAGVGIGAQAAAQAGIQYVERVVHTTEQNEIARAAGELSPGAAATWSVRHDLPIEDNEHGRVAVTRLIDAASKDAAIHCKEIVFSVDTVEDKHPASAFYTATVCRDGTAWKWATAEPATERWGSLQ